MYLVSRDHGRLRYGRWFDFFSSSFQAKNLSDTWTDFCHRFSQVPIDQYLTDSVTLRSNRWLKLKYPVISRIDLIGGGKAQSRLKRAFSLSILQNESKIGFIFKRILLKYLQQIISGSLEIKWIMWTWKMIVLVKTL